MITADQQVLVLQLFLHRQVTAGTEIKGSHTSTTYRLVLLAHFPQNMIFCLIYLILYLLLVPEWKICESETDNCKRFTSTTVIQQTHCWKWNIFLSFMEVAFFPDWPSDRHASSCQLQWHHTGLQTERFHWLGVVWTRGVGACTLDWRPRNQNSS